MFIRDQPRIGKGRRKDWTEVEVGPNAQVFRPHLVSSLDTGQLWRLWPQVRQPSAAESVCCLHALLHAFLGDGAGCIFHVHHGCSQGDVS